MNYPGPLIPCPLIPLTEFIKKLQITMRRLLLLSILLLAAAGCGPSFKTVPVSGRVTLDDKPVANAGVLYVPVNQGPTARAMTDQDGRYKLMTGNLTGTAPGPYRVAVMRDEVSGVAVGADGLETTPGKAATKRGLPSIYADPNTTPLEITIDAERNDANLKMTSK